MGGMTEFGRVLHLYRKRARITQAGLGAMLGLDQTTISGWEHSSSLPRDWDIYSERVAEALHVPTAVLEGSASIAEERAEYEPKSTTLEGVEINLKMIEKLDPEALEELARIILAVKEKTERERG